MWGLYTHFWGIICVKHLVLVGVPYMMGTFKFFVGEGCCLGTEVADLGDSPDSSIHSLIYWESTDWLLPNPVWEDFKKFMKNTYYKKLYMNFNLFCVPK